MRKIIQITTRKSIIKNNNVNCWQEPLEGIEPSTYSLPRNRYTSKPQRQFRYCPEYQGGLFYFFPSNPKKT